ncbi:hypothetical protein [Enterococcus larvae]|uniref:hypothetical protein n=1 Tax=Enterococcus larvae TaxID=2794352 RepID=UPI003F376793
MKNMSCTACGSTELTKKGNHYVCSYCNSSYLEETTAKVPPTKTIVKNIFINKTEPPPKQQEVKKVSFFKKIFGLPFFLIGSLLLIIGLGFLKEGILFEAAFFGWPGLILTNLSYTTITGKQILLTKKFNGWQLFLITILLIVIAIVMIS